MRELDIIDTVPLFPELHGELLALLRSLNAQDWQRPTVCAGWTVKDIAAHLLDGTLRRLSMQRDGYFGVAEPAGDGYGDLVDFLNRLNAEWVAAAQRLSPAVLIGLIEQSGREHHAFLRTLNPQAPAPFAVTWAGDSESPNWFDTAREYTERWHHQQQIRLAVERSLLMQWRWYFPVLDTFMRGLPHAYRHCPAPHGSIVCVEITGEAGGRWYLHRHDAWQLVVDVEQSPNVCVRVEAEVAWRLLTNGISGAEAHRHVAMTGDARLGTPFLKMRCVMVG